MASPFLVLCSQSFLWLTYASAHAANGGVLEATISAHGSFDHHVGANLNVEATDPKSSLTGASYGEVEATEVSHDAAKRNHVVRRESEGEKQGGFAEATHHAKYASAAVNASTVTEIHLIGDDVVVAQDHVCGGAGAHEVERYPGPTERTLLECRQACMDDKNCYYYAYWPEGNGQKNTDGECKNNCRLYDRCSDHSSNHEQIDTVSCRAFLFKIGPTTETQRPAYARHHKASIQSSARDPRQAFSLAFTIAAALASISQC